MFLVQITKQYREDDIHKTFTSELEATIFVMSNLKSDSDYPEMQDGYRIFSYNPGSGSELRPDSKALLRIYTEADSENIYDTIAEARSHITNPSAGYDLIDLEQPVGSASSIIMESRPSLYSQNGVVASRRNTWDRSDPDRW